MVELKKELSLLTATFYGIGIILGAGIYVLIGKGAGIAGDSLWLSFVVASIIASFTGLSYAELAGMFPRTAAEYVYTKNAFGKESLAFIVQWLMIFTLIIAAGVVALGFGGYFSYLFKINTKIAAIGLLIILSLLNYRGIKDSANFTIFSTIVEMSGLLLVIIIGLFFIRGANIDYLGAPGGVSAILSGTALVFFAYIGFEELVNLSEDTKDASNVIPKALLLSLLVSTILYILVSISSIAIIGSKALAASAAPLSDVVATVIPQAGLLMSFIALFATANTVLVMLIVASRMLYGLACNNSIPGVCSLVGRRQTPYVSIGIVLVLSITAMMLSGIQSIALLTDIGIFIVYVFVNSSVIALRYKMPDQNRTFKTPLSIGKFPVIALLGLLSSGYMLFHFETRLLLYELIVIGVGLLLFKIFTNINKLKDLERKYTKLFEKWTIKQIKTSSKIKS